ncbi:MAG: RsiV family protein, partial [Arenimonas sp.]
FNPYEVAPYAAGAPSVNLPWSSLAPWLTAPVRDAVSLK